MAVTNPGTLPEEGRKRDTSRGVKTGETGGGRETTCKASFSALCEKTSPPFSEFSVLRQSLISPA